MRDRFMAALREHVAALWMLHPRLVVAQTFLKQSHRRELARRFPEARFVLVTASASVRAARLSRRINERLEGVYLRTMVAAFDPPVGPFARLANTGDDAQLERALDALVRDAARPTAK
jgi:gluconate kinase